MISPFPAETITGKIEQMLAATKALRAPAFSLDDFARTAAAIEAEIAEDAARPIRENVENIFEELYGRSTELIADLTAIHDAACLAFARAAGFHLPEALGIEDLDEKSEARTIGHAIVKRYADKTS